MFKKINILVIVMLLSLSSITRVNAANGVNISSNKVRMNVGESATITVSADDSHTFDGNAYASGAGSGSLSGIGLFTGGSQSFNVTAHSVGIIYVTVSGQSVDIFNTDAGGKSASAQVRIEVGSPSTGGGGSSGGGSTSSGGGSTSSGGGSTSSGGNTILDRPSDVETEDERVAREEREAEEKKALEAKVPLVSSIEVVSKSDKKRDKTLVDLEVEAESYEYSYELPSFVEDVSLKVNAVEGASVDYDVDHSVTEEKVVKIKATKGDIVQEYSLTLNPSSYEFVETDDGVVYQDESLDEVFKGYGFELKDIERDSKKMRMFSKDKLNLQMVMNDDKSVVFHRLSDEGVFEEKGQLLFEDEDVLFVKMQAPEGFENESLKGSKFKSITLPEYEFLTDVDESLLKTVDAQGWSYDENQKVVHALNAQLEADLYNIDESNNIKMAVLSFDHKSPILFYGLLVTVILLLCSLILNGILFKKNRSLNHI